MLIVLNADGSTSLLSDPASGNPYDSSDGDTVGVLNNSGSPIPSVALTSSTGPIFGFDHDGICAQISPPPLPAGCPFDPNAADPGNDYAGPGVTFGSISSSAGGTANAGVVRFAGGLAPGASTFFALEGLPSSASFSRPAPPTPAPPPPPQQPGKAAPTLSGQAAPATAGGTVSATATLAGGSSPTGPITFSVFATPDCSGAPVTATSVSANGNGRYSPVPFRMGQAGTFAWLITYAGDGANNGASTGCGTVAETVTKATPALAGESAQSTVGGTVSERVALTGGAAPTGTLTFSLYRTADCSGKPNGAVTVPVTGNGPYSSGNLPAAGPGSYRWVVAYSGDANNASSSLACGVQASSVSRAVPSVSTTPAPAKPVGAAGVVSTVAVLAGGAAPTGRLVFNLYASSACTGAALASSSAPVKGDGSYASQELPVTQAGPFGWAVSYSGDPANAGASAPCAPTPVTASHPTLTLAIAAPSTGAPAVAVGGVATLAGGSTPHGDLVFALYGSQACTGTPAVTATAQVSDNGTYRTTLTPPTPGSYQVVASYTGDVGNLPAETSCGAVPATLGGAQPSPSPTTGGGSQALPPVRDGANSGGGLVLFAVVAGCALATAMTVLVARQRAALLPAEAPAGLPPARPARVPPPIGQSAPAGTAAIGASLTRSREALGERLRALQHKGRLDDEAFEAIEDALIRAGLGVKATGAAIEGLRRRKGELDALPVMLRQGLLALLGPTPRSLVAGPKGSGIVVVIGASPGASSRSAAKLAKLLEAQGLTPVGSSAPMGLPEATAKLILPEPPALLVLPLVASEAHSAVAAGMRELRRMAGRLGGGNMEVLLVCDASAGAAAVARYSALAKAIRPSGLIVAGVEGASGGGVVVAFEVALGVPVKVLDLGGEATPGEPFNPAAFVDALLGGMTAG